MTALNDPVLEAAVQILAPWVLNDPSDVDEMRMRIARGLEEDKARARIVILEAARQVDALRKLGTIPKGEADE